MVEDADIGQEGVRDSLVASRIAGDLLAALKGEEGAARSLSPVDNRVPVLIEGNAEMPLGAAQARRLLALLYVRMQIDAGAIGMEAWGHRLSLPEDPAPPEVRPFADGDIIDLENSMYTPYYLFGRIGRETMMRLADLVIDLPRRQGEKAVRTVPLVHKLWLNHTLGRHVYDSVRTVKCDAARTAFSAAGEEIVWAVADTGIDAAHPHFQAHGTLDLPAGIDHHDFTGAGKPLQDSDGHGSHVAGIIAGETRVGGPTGDKAQAVGRLCVKRSVRQPDGKVVPDMSPHPGPISGIAPKCKLVSLKVLSAASGGDVGLLLAAIGYIQQANDHGANLRIHGLNLSLGYSFDARWFATGRSPLCVEVDRLVRSGVVVVVSAGNSGYGPIQALNMSFEQAAHLGTISDPGNAELAITVGSTHRNEPHNYGVSYFSGKGPTADGRMKPDLLAPGERIVSVAPYDPANPGDAPFRQDSGTSMAAPHVSGCIAAFLSVRREFRGEPEKVKAIFKASATDLGRTPSFQGAGLLDVMRALQSV